MVRKSSRGLSGEERWTARLILSMVMSSVIGLMVWLHAFPYKIQDAVSDRNNDAKAVLINGMTIPRADVRFSPNSGVKADMAAGPSWADFVAKVAN
jgi:hypothetical protein